MKNSIIRELFKRLSHAPETVAKQYLDELQGKDKEETEKYLNYLGIQIRPKPKE